MRLTDFALHASERLLAPATSQRMLHIAEGIVVALREHTIEAPFRIVVIRLSPPDRRPMRRASIIDRNLELEARVEPFKLGAEYEEFRSSVFDVIQDALARAKAERPDDPIDALAHVVDQVRSRDRIGLLELDWLRKQLRGQKAEVRVFHEVTETDARTWIEIQWQDGRVRGVDIRQEKHPVVCWASFPGHTAKLVDGDYVAFRKDGRELYRLPAEALAG